MPSQPYDLAILGAGPAGVAAASAAAELGARVLLIEATNRVGGSVVAAMHRSLCGLYSQMPDSPIDTLNAGAQREVVRHLLDDSPRFVAVKQFGKAVVLEFPSAAYEAALLYLIDQPNIDRRMNATITAVHREADHLTAIEVDGSLINARAFIDCTGRGALLRMIGEDVMHPADTQRMLGGYSIRLAGLNTHLQMLRVRVPYVLAQGVERGQLPAEAKFTMFHPGPGPDEGICKLAINPERFDHLGQTSLAEMTIDYLRSNLPELAGMTITEVSPRALPRDGRRLLGRATLTETDVLEARQLGPQAVHAWWPIEHWDTATGPGYAYPPIGRHYDIPVEAMRSAVIDNLYAAGLCVSATATAAASLRASGICLATGHAAGAAAVAPHL